MILYSDELETARNGGVGVCLSENVSIYGHRHPEAGVFLRDGRRDRLYIRPFGDEDVCKSVDMQRVLDCQERGAVLSIAGIGEITVSKKCVRRGEDDDKV